MHMSWNLIYIPVCDLCLVAEGKHFANFVVSLCVSKGIMRGGHSATRMVIYLFIFGQSMVKFSIHNF